LLPVQVLRFVLLAVANTTRQTVRPTAAPRLLAKAAAVEITFKIIEQWQSTGTILTEKLTNALLIKQVVPRVLTHYIAQERQRLIQEFTVVKAVLMKPYQQKATLYPHKDMLHIPNPAARFNGD
jgi:hypothetical protein